MIQLCGVESCIRDWCKMRMCLAGAAVCILASSASAEDYGRPTAILVNPIHEAQLVRGDDGMDHVEYDLLVVSVFSEPVTLSSVAVLDSSGKELMRMEGTSLPPRPRPCSRRRRPPSFPRRRRCRSTSI
jgi:hypothetical protein